MTVRKAPCEDRNLAEFSQLSVQRGSVVRSNQHVFRGEFAACATLQGGGGNGYARGIWDVTWPDGMNTWFRAAFFLPAGFHDRIQGQTDLMRWDNWSTNPDVTDWGGISIYGSDHRARLLRFGDGRPNDVLVGPFDLPEGRWFTLKVHQLRGATDGKALSEVYRGANLIGKSTAANTYGRYATRIRFGLVAIAEDKQTNPLQLWFDDALARS